MNNHVGASKSIFFTCPDIGAIIFMIFFWHFEVCFQVIGSYALISQIGSLLNQSHY
jgi:hypothetical protein